MKKTVYCVTVINNVWTDEVWPKVEDVCNAYSNVVGDAIELGTQWQVWAASTDEKQAREVFDKLLGMYPELEDVLHIEKVEHELEYDPRFGEYSVK
ncbi:MAG: hypothetical protein H0Z24_03215 [Thermosipho sp. (in: Bacteria)]|nr:hypothetical protein [Thermosipho sp. (in: thermotogales)]